jgi:hypothetical protein
MHELCASSRARGEWRISIISDPIVLIMLQVSHCSAGACRRCSWRTCLRLPLKTSARLAMTQPQRRPTEPQPAAAAPRCAAARRSTGDTSAAGPHPPELALTSSNKCCKGAAEPRQQEQLCPGPSVLAVGTPTTPLAPLWCRGTFRAGSSLLGGGEHPPDTFLSTPGFSKVGLAPQCKGFITRQPLLPMLHSPGSTPHSASRWFQVDSELWAKLLLSSDAGPGLHQRLQPGLVLAGAGAAADGLHPRWTFLLQHRRAILTLLSVRQHTACCGHTPDGLTTRLQCYRAAPEGRRQRARAPGGDGSPQPPHR